MVCVWFLASWILLCGGRGRAEAEGGQAVHLRGSKGWLEDRAWPERMCSPGVPRGEGEQGQEDRVGRVLSFSENNEERVRFGHFWKDWAWGQPYLEEMGGYWIAWCVTSVDPQETSTGKFCSSSVLLLLGWLFFFFLVFYGHGSI